MANVENTIGMGLSKIQDGLDKSKNKVELMKEISKINKVIEDVNSKKAEALLELGVHAYKKVREGYIQDQEIIEKCKGIIGFDHIVYENKRKIEELKKINDGFACSCGTILNYDDKFCGGCGKKVEMPLQENNEVLCERCESFVKENANFCPCCGSKMR